ncbi:Na+/H+ antiporter family protein [Bhargavaea ullalensis]|uniref:Histidine transporter YuiF (NhaC family) n=1 Tax=Bhargavaea ullalensis TaxID=1265685 RepID=A0ABV2G7S7_9BACL
MNAVILAVAVMLILSLLRVNVVLALAIGALAGGFTGGMSIHETVDAFTEGLGGGATIALSYALLGGFAVAISKTGIPEVLVRLILKVVGEGEEKQRKGLAKALVVVVLLLIAISSQNLIPIHIAFIPLLVPPILHILNMLKIDRRLIACVLAFGLTAPYILLPVGFGLLFHEVLFNQMQLAGLTIDMSDIPRAMAIPVGGMFIGLLVAVFISYRKPRDYGEEEADAAKGPEADVPKRNIVFTVIALAAALAAQIGTDSMIIGAIAGIAVLYATGAVRWKEADELLNQGMKMMAFVGFVMIAANGFAGVIQATGDVESLVHATSGMLGDNKTAAAFMMLLVGLLVTMGIGSSFATIPIIAAIFVPLSIEFGFSTLAIVSLIGTAGALGDAGSPASDSTLGPTAGLDVDGKHNHIWDTCVPTFLHYNIPLIVFGWIAAMIL